MNRRKQFHLPLRVPPGTPSSTTLEKRAEAQRASASAQRTFRKYIRPRRGPQMKQLPIMFRQGDVLVVLDPVAQVPAGAQEVAPDKGRVVLAYGEVTGHAHAIAFPAKTAPKVKYWDAGAERYLQVLEQVALKHEEHSTIMLERGVYRQAFQVEERGEEVRRVAD
jgi:hypothetical protein